MLPHRATVDLGVMAMKGYSAFPKLQYCWNPTIRLFSVISRQSVYSIAPADWAKEYLKPFNCVHANELKLFFKCYQQTANRIREFIAFPEGFSPKVNVIATLEFELAYYEAAFHQVNHHTTRIPPVCFR